MVVRVLIYRRVPDPFVVESRGIFITTTLSLSLVVKPRAELLSVIVRYRAPLISSYVKPQTGLMNDLSKVPESGEIPGESCICTVGLRA